MTEVISALEKTESPLFVTHRQADRDSLGSAIALRAFLDRGTVCTPDGVERSARRLLEATETNPVTSTEEVDFDSVVVLDSPSKERIEPVGPDEVILIDHHEPEDLGDIASSSLVETEADATSALTARLAFNTERKVSPEVALPLLVGVFGDTDNLTKANEETVQLAGKLIESLDYRADEFSELIGQEKDQNSSRRNGRVIGVLRASGYRSGDWFVAFSEVGAHESAVAEELLDGGVDCVFVFSEQSEGYRVSARASDRFTREANLGGSLLPEVADEFGGHGGGHKEAGVATVPSDNRGAVEKYVLGVIEDRLDSSFSPVTGSL